MRNNYFPVLPDVSVAHQEVIIILRSLNDITPPKAK